jgi:ATPase subunit of ABC transporter with duplicated ATPase domains
MHVLISRLMTERDSFRKEAAGLRGRTDFSSKLESSVESLEIALMEKHDQIVRLEGRFMGVTNKCMKLEVENETLSRTLGWKQTHYENTIKMLTSHLADRESESAQCLASQVKSMRDLLERQSTHIVEIEMGMRFKEDEIEKISHVLELKEKEVSRLECELAAGMKEFAKRANEMQANLLTREIQLSHSESERTKLDLRLNTLTEELERAKEGERKSGEQLVRIGQLELELRNAVIAKDHNAISALFEILNGKKDADSGTYTWGITIKPVYLPVDNNEYFKNDLNLIDWLRQYSTDQDETYIRGFLGKMLFSGEETLKKSSVLSGGEKMRCMISRMMLHSGNLLILDEPTNHLDLESITAFNNSVSEFKGPVLLTSHDHAFMQTTATRVIELFPDGFIDRQLTYDEFLENSTVQDKRAELIK